MQVESIKRNQNKQQNLNVTPGLGRKNSKENTATKQGGIVFGGYYPGQINVEDDFVNRSNKPQAPAFI